MDGGIGAGGHKLSNPPGMGNGLMPGSNIALKFTDISNNIRL